MKCPGGHEIPYVCKNGARCTAKFCGDKPFVAPTQRLKSSYVDPEFDKVQANKENHKARLEKAEAASEAATAKATDVASWAQFDTTVDEAVKDAVKKELNLMRVKDTIRKTRDGVPPDLEGEEATAWVKDEINRIAPEALLRIRGNLRYGSDQQRDRAAERFLDMAGFSKADRAVGGNAPIIMLNLGGMTQLPWSQAKPVEVKATPVLPPEASDAEE